MKINITKKKVLAGIDFGTTESLIYTLNFSKKIQSTLYFNKDGTISVLNNDALFYIKSVKRLLTEKHELLEYISDDEFLFFNKKYSIIDCIAIILKELVQELDILAVITVPAKFDYVLRNKILAAAELASIKVLRIIAEPTAAAFFYTTLNKDYSKFLVYDLGGGTFDLSLVKVNDLILRVLETDGDAHLGGDDLDLVIAKKYHISTIEARRLKEENLISDIDDLAFQVFQSTIKKVDKYESSLPLILVGGGSIVMKKFFTNRKVLIDSLPFQTAVVQGAFEYAKSIILNNKFLLVDVLPVSIGIETFGQRVEKILHRNSPLPISSSAHFTNQVAGQRNMHFTILQGESENLNLCEKITTVHLNNLPIASAAHLNIQVFISVNINGIVSFKATCNDQVCHTEYNLYSSLSDAKINEMIDLYNEEQEDLFKEYKKLLDVLHSYIRIAYNVPEFISYKPVLNPERKDIEELKLLIQKVKLIQ